MSGSPATAAVGSSVFDLLVRGGPVMWPLLGMSIASITIALERIFFWVQVLMTEDQVVHDVLAAARYSLDEGVEIAEQAQSSPIARFLLAPLRLRNPNPDTFRLAQETAAEKEFIKMRRGDKMLETVVGLAPLLGLLGTVTGLIATFSNLNVGGGATDTKAASAAAAGIGEALLTTAFGMIVAIIALVILRVLLVLQTQQMDYFTEVGSRLELIYRQNWYEPYVGDLGRSNLNTYDSRSTLTTGLSTSNSINSTTNTYSAAGASGNNHT